jgi:hypothetical protein
LRSRRIVGIEPIPCTLATEICIEKSELWNRHS